MTATSNTTEEINIITGLKGFSYVIDKNANTEPENVVNYEVNVQADKMAEIGIKLDKKYINNGYYLHVKAIDKVGNVSGTLHIPLNYEERNIILYKTYQEAKDINDRGLAETEGWNYIDLYWDKLSVRSDYQNPYVVIAIDRSGSMSSNNKIGQVKNAATAFVNNVLGKLPQSQVGIIGFNNSANVYVNPTNNLQSIVNAINGITVSDGKYTSTGVNKAREILNSSNSKNKVLVLITDGKPEDSWATQVAMANARSEEINIITVSIDTNNNTLINGSDSYYGVSSGGNSIYNTLSQTIYNDMVNNNMPKYNLFRKKEGDSNYTQITNGITENTYSDKDAKDLTGPLKPIGRMTLTKDKQSLNLKIWVEDAGTSYDYYLEAIMGNTGEIIYSNNVVQEVKTGVKGFAWTIDSDSNTDPGSNISELPESFDKSYIGQYIHIRGIDYAGNLGQVLHLMIDDGRLIPEEELDQTKELFCVQHGQTIPALVDGRYLNATVKAGTGGNHGDGEDNVNKDEDGNIVGYGNVIEGNVWEDLRTGEFVEQLINNQVVGDGIRQQEEPLVNNVKIDLIEMFENKTTGYKMERIVDSQNTRLLLSLSNESKLDGGYRFDELPTGKYKVQFTYGTEEQLTQDLKYNGQDFQGVKTDDIYKDSNTQNNYDNIEIMLNMDVSNSMTGEKIDNVKQSSIKLIENLYDRLQGIKIGVVQFRNEANILVKPTNDSNQVVQAIQNMSASGETAIAQGIEKTIEAYSDDIDKKIMIILTDGKETVDNNEDVIRQIENATDKKDIDLITLLTEESKQIFGTEEHPRRGELYLLSSNNNIEDLITNTIYQELLELSIVKKDRSFGKDIQGDENTPGTRIYNMNKYKIMGNENAEVLNIERVSNLKGNDRIEAIKKIANTTYMTAITESLQIQANNVGASKIEQINLGIRERPKVELTLDSEIQTIKVTLSDGTVIIDTEKGVSKNVMGANKKGVPISVYIDEEIMHGANVTIKYKIRITNTGEIDRLSNYIDNGDDSTIPTRATIVYNYTNKNALFKTDTDNDIWHEITQEEAKNNINSQVLESVRDGNKKIYKTEELNAELYPIGSIELEEEGDNYIEVVLTMSKVISPQDTTETLSFDSMMEIIQRYNEAGRRSYTSIPGNYVVGSGITEPDSTENSRVIITKPLGCNLSLKYVCIALAILSIMLIIILVIKFKLDNNKKPIIYK